MTGAALVGLVLAVTGGPAASAAQPRRETASTFKGSVQSLSAKSEVGQVTVRAGDVSRVVIREWWRLLEPTVTVKHEAGALSIVAKCPDNILLNDCRVDLDVTVPATTSANASVAAGDVVVRGMSGDTRARSSAGSVVIERVTAAVVEGETGAGRVTLKDVSAARVKASSSSGGVRVDLATAPESVVGRSGAGNVEIRVPAGAYAITVKTGAGDDEIIGLVNDPKSARKIVATTSSGDVLVKAR